ncbi:transposase [Nocardia jiangxiensis]|uniref:transposase n=1 Tax=Nocardia jiangxiensis TaxID=282685 RepID=UPI001FDEB680|nr:transposase [Nocardia jiangxiensis]
MRLRAGERVAEIAAETGISAATLFKWKAQALVDGESVRVCRASRPTSWPPRIAGLPSWRPS